MKAFLENESATLNDYKAAPRLEYRTILRMNDSLMILDHVSFPSTPRS